MKELTELAQQLARANPDPKVFALRQATINSVNWSLSNTAYVNLRFPGSTTDVPAKFLCSYAPQVGHVVWALQNGPDLLVLGYVNGYTGNFDIGPGNSADEGGQLNLKGAENGAGADWADVQVDNYRSDLRFLTAGGVAWIGGSDGEHYSKRGKRLTEAAVGGPIIASGTANVTISAAASAFASVNFGVTFAAAPKVLLTIATLPAGAAKLIPKHNAPSTTAFDCYVYTGDGTNVSCTVAVDWLAIGT